MVKRVFLLLGLGFTWLGCTPSFPDRQSQIQGTRILGIRSDPAEAAPGAAVVYSTLVVNPEGTVTAAPIDWAFCTQPHALGDLNDISSACFVFTADYLKAVGEVGPGTSGKLPTNACRQFGPDVPDSMPGVPPGRPADPDSTGGYYQPVRLILPDDDGQFVLAAGTTRLECGLPAATREELVAFKTRYRANANPSLAVGVLGVPLTSEGTLPLLSPDDGMTSPLTLPQGRTLHLRAAWPTCPATSVCGDGICSADEDVTSCADDCTTPLGCAGAEPYVAFDLLSLTVNDRRESMRVSWFATDGSFTNDRTGREESDPITSTDNDWTAPAASGDVHIWIVLRDSRGGIAWESYLVHVN